MTVIGGASGTYRSLVPARLDRLPWRRFHTRVVVVLGISWILERYSKPHVIEKKNNPRAAL
jgi:hypothetical protein